MTCKYILNCLAGIHGQYKPQKKEPAGLPGHTCDQRKRVDDFYRFTADRERIWRAAFLFLELLYFRCVHVHVGVRVCCF